MGVHGSWHPRERCWIGLGRGTVRRVSDQADGAYVGPTAIFAQFRKMLPFFDEVMIM